MDTMLFSERSVWTMIHGIGLGGGALLALAAVAWLVLHFRWRERQIESRRGHAITLLLVAVGVLLSFPPLWRYV